MKILIYFWFIQARVFVASGATAVSVLYCFIISFTFAPGVLAACIDVIGIPKRVLTSPDLAAYVMAEGDDGEEGGRAEARSNGVYVCMLKQTEKTHAKKLLEI